LQEQLLLKLEYLPFCKDWNPEVEQSLMELGNERTLFLTCWFGSILAIGSRLLCALTNRHVSVEGWKAPTVEGVQEH
jgi:hypothetical protein